MKKNIRIIISAGGTGGHIFPALATANKLRELCSQVEIKFVGAQGRMEMKKVPDAGYPIVGLPVMGFPRKPSLKIFTFLNKLLKAIHRAKRVVREFKPHVAVGFGGYASGPVLRVVAKRKIPYVLQEQNSYAGITNRLLAKKAAKICVAYQNMDKYFPKEKIVFTGNPIRSLLVNKNQEKSKGCKEYGLDPKRKIVLVTGGSQGAHTINEAIYINRQYFYDNNIQLLWQCGSYYFKEFSSRLGYQVDDHIYLTKFIDNMELAYACADVVIARAGASTISELCVLEKPSILIPSPNVAEDHQTHNAQSLSDKNAAILLPDAKAKEELLKELDKLLSNPEKAKEMAANMKPFASEKADEQIAREILKLVGVNE